MYGHYLRDMPDTTDIVGTWEWLRTADLKVQTESSPHYVLLRSKLIGPTGLNILIRRQIPPFVDCVMRRARMSIMLWASVRLEKLAQNEYKRRHDNVARAVHWKLREEYGLERSEKWYEDTPKSVVENDRIKILWDVSIQCDHVIKDRRPDIIIINKEDENCFIVDIAITKGKVTLFYVGSSFSCQNGINGNPLHPPPLLLSVLRFTDI